MPFGNITAQTIVYEPRKPGTYIKSGLAIGAPLDEFRLSGATPSSRAKLLSVSVTRLKQKDFIAPGTTTPVRVNALVSINVQLPNDGSFTSAEGDSLLSDIAEFITPTTLSRLASGEI